MDSLIAENNNEGLLKTHTESKDISKDSSNDSGCEKSDINSSESVNGLQVDIITVETKEIVVDDGEDTEDLVILRKDPKTRRNFINKSAYAKLHRTLSSTRNSSTIDSLKEKYEHNAKPDLVDVQSESDTQGETNKQNETDKHTLKRTPAVKLDEETVQLLKTKYSPASFGYPKSSKSSKLPVAKPRGAVKSQIILPSSKISDKNKTRHSLPTNKKNNTKDENSNELYRKNSSSSGEFITIITRSESEASVDKLEKELNLFTMEGKSKEKKRSSSFRKIFSGKLFGKDKKKKEEEKKQQYKENIAYNDNLHNESNTFNRQLPYRHTTGGNGSTKPKENNIARNTNDRIVPRQNLNKEIEERYAQMHVQEFNHIKKNFENKNTDLPSPPPEDYIRMDKPIKTNNPGPTNYMNMPNVKKYIDTSSSASTLESNQSNIYQNEIPANVDKQNILREELENRNEQSGSLKFNRDTPPRAQELRQDVRLVSPKALIPINSERPLPNPYQNSEKSSLEKPKVGPKPNVANLNKAKYNEKGKVQPHVEETYGTVFDSLEQKKVRVLQRVPSKSGDLKEPQKSPKSPSFEATKLKLPPNREIVPLSPRVKSPIPQDNVSTEKIIATELLRPTRSPTPTIRSNTKLSSPSHQKLEVDIDYPDNITNERNEKIFENNILAMKPPISKTQSRKSPEGSSPSTDGQMRQIISQHSPAFDNKRSSQVSPAFENWENANLKYRLSRGSPVVENQEKIITNALVHVNSSNVRTPTPNSLLHNRSLSPMTPQSARSSTPVDARISPSTKSSQSPQKEDMRRSVEAYYWKEIKKLKEQENYDLYLYQMQMMPYGYAEDPISIRRSRSLSPTSHKNSRRSLSLPRDSRPKEIPENYRIQPESIPEGRAVINQQIPQRNIVYGQQFQYQQNFRRNTPERRTIEGSPRNYDNSLYRPIFKRGSLTTPVKELVEDQQNKKVSFSSSRSDTQSLQSWPTKNGFTQSPPQRRIDNNRHSTVDDDVFLPNTPHIPQTVDGIVVYGYTSKPQNLRYDYSRKTNDDYYNSRQILAAQNNEVLYGANPDMRYRTQEPVYGQSNGRQIYVNQQDDLVYGQPVDAVKPSYNFNRHGSLQMQEPLYEQRQLAPRRMSYDNTPANLPIQSRKIPEPQYVNRQVPSQNQPDPRYGLQRREIIMNDEIFGQFGGYLLPSNEDRYLQNRQPPNPMYSSRQSVAESIYGRSGPKQISVRNKVCDIYGQIHDRDSPSLTPPNQIKKTGVLIGQLQSNPGSPQVARQAHLSNEQFARNTRLTASASDMYRRYQNTDPRYRSDVIYGGVRYPNQEVGAPTRPLPPVPMDKKLLMRNNSGKSDTESASDASEIQRVMSSSTKNKKRSFFGK